ncbi:hypothetical protein NCC49_001712 [Naganishia albida]|nr:hypothetical protein NCC49_001712 [Naganishia albida]
MISASRSVLSSTLPNANGGIRRSFSSTTKNLAEKKRKIVVIGAGFIGSYIAKALISDSRNTVVLASRNPDKLYQSLKGLGAQLLPPAKVDISQPSTITPAVEGADAVISLVGILTGTEKQFIDLQEKGGQNVAKAAKDAGVKRVVMVSALGIDGGETPYARTKLAAEKAFRTLHPTATIVRPSLVFGPGDQFFARFAKLAKFLPFLPVFGGGNSRFQPVYVGDVAKAVEVVSRDDIEIVNQVGGKIIEAGGPEVFTYRDLMKITLNYAGLASRRFVISLPFWVGYIQGFFLEKLPESMFTVTRDQVKQLKKDNIESDPSNPNRPQDRISIADLLTRFPPANTRTSMFSLDASVNDPRSILKSVHDILPTYIGEGAQTAPVSGKRMHGRKGAGTDEMLAEVKRMTEKSGFNRSKQ